MFVKLENKFDEKYDMWVNTSEIEQLMDINIINNTRSNYKKDIVVWCHEPESDFGIKFVLFGCLIIGHNKISFDYYKLFKR